MDIAPIIAFLSADLEVERNGPAAWRYSLIFWEVCTLPPSDRVLARHSSLGCADRFCLVEKQREGG
jgi:hypothetical protein